MGSNFWVLGLRVLWFILGTQDLGVKIKDLGSEFKFWRKGVNFPDLGIRVDELELEQNGSVLGLGLIDSIFWSWISSFGLPVSGFGFFF